MVYCIIDTGADSSNPDLGQAVISGCPDMPTTPCWQWNADSSGHGTHTAGTVGAVRNGLGVVGVAAETARIYIYNIFGTYASFPETALVSAWEYCVAELDALKASVSPDFKLVVSMSLGGDGEATGPIQQALDALYARGDVLFIAAAGNDGNTLVNYPAGYASVISVAATDSQNNRAGFSNYNSDVELAAPGVSTLSTLTYGTAMAGPSVATSPPVYGDPADDNLQSPPPAAMDGSGSGTVTGTGCTGGMATCRLAGC